MSEYKITPEIQAKIDEIDDKIEDLRDHQSMWFHAGGHGGRMAMQAHQEIHDLEMQKEDLMNGTHKYEIHELEMKKRRLLALKKESSLFKRSKISKSIKEVDQELEELLSTESEEKVDEESKIK